MAKKTVRQVAVFVDTSSSHGRGVLRGVHRFQEEHGYWGLILRPHTPTHSPSWLRKWPGDGILASVASTGFASSLKRLKLPVVNVFYRPGHSFPQLLSDNREIGRLAVEHLLDRGLRTFGFVGWPRGLNARMDDRCDWFVHYVREAGYECTILPAWRTDSSGQIMGREHERICDWLLRLPKPVGVMACCDMCGVDVLAACRLAQVHVPQQVAVVSTDDDEIFCTLSDPPLSSVRADFEGLGYQAALLLDRMMQGRRAPKRPIMVPPLFVAARASTDVLATSDKELAVALHYIRQHACRGLSVDEVLSVVPLSRNSLEQRMKKAIGRTPKAEIIRLQLERVKELLLTTDLPLATIASRAGYEYPQYMAEVFRRRFGMTPRTFRRKHAAVSL